MKSWQIDQWGLEHLKLTESLDPAPGPGEVKVQFKAASLNYRDLLVIEGKYNPKLERPLIPCSDGFGQIVEVGPGVSESLLKRYVITTFCPLWISGKPKAAALRQTLGGPLPGVLQQYRLFRPEELILLEEPSALTPGEWASIPCAGVTAWHCLTAAGIQAGQSVLLIGTGGVSLFGLQIAKIFGARVLLLSSSEEKQERAKELGADVVGNYSKEPDWGKWALEKTGGQGVDIVLETGGAGTLGQSLRAVKIGGHIPLVGVLSGREQALDIIPLMMKNVTLQGIVVGSKQHSLDLMEALLQNMVRPMVDLTFDWDDLPSAFEALRSARHFGKITIDFPREH